MFFAISDDSSWRVAWAHQSWKLQAGQSVELELHVDGVGPYRVTAKASDPDLVSAELAATSA